jgi:osmotically-inducible protein OsmY
MAGTIVSQIKAPDPLSCTRLSAHFRANRKYIMSRDLELRANIEAELEFEPSVTAAGIGVAVKDGVATLTGTVPTYYEKLAAERAVGRVNGVRAVAEELEVKLPFDVKHDDTEMARRASNILEWGSFPSIRADHVKVSKGWVTLSGEVEWQFQREAATAAVRRLAGVVGVTNLITIRSRVTTGDVKDHIGKAFKRSAELEASGINVSVEGGKVSLSGKVHNWSDRRAAENAAWAMPSVTQVIDNLVVA